MRKILVLLLAAALLFSAAYAEENGAVTEKDGWHFDENGFLTGENPGEEYLLEDEKNGVWQYATADLSIRINRYEETVKVKSGKRKRIYCIADIHCTPASPLFTITTPRTRDNVKKYVGLPGYHNEKPDKLAKQNSVVLAISDDYYGGRMQKVIAGRATWPIGVIIRNGELINSKTRKAGKAAWPQLDTLAVYGDGSMKAEPVAAKGADEFVAEGAVQVFAFGPWLIHEGEINTKGVDSGAKTYMYNDAQYSEPRVALGMVEPYHYIAIAAMGRPESKYIGVKLDWLADRMLQLGCTEAMNMDGGGTVAMVFNGKTILNGYNNDPRSIGSMVAFGRLDSAAE